jgi:hypothetical protein
MKNLISREFLENLLKKSFYKRKGYFCCDFEGKHYKRSRIVIQLALNKSLGIWEIVHHKDGNKENDSPENLEVIDTSNFNQHTSIHFAGKRGK